MVNEEAQTGIQDEFDEWECATPLMPHEEGGVVPPGGLTPYLEGTPYAQGGRTSEYVAQTPGIGATSVYEAAFSPGANVYASPGYASPNAYPQSPVYGSPASPIYGAGGAANKVQSPIYGNIYASPIYQGANEIQSAP